MKTISCLTVSNMTCSVTSTIASQSNFEIVRCTDIQTFDCIFDINSKCCILIHTRVNIIIGFTMFWQSVAMVTISPLSPFPWMACGQFLLLYNVHISWFRSWLGCSMNCIVGHFCVNIPSSENYWMQCALFISKQTYFNFSSDQFFHISNFLR